MARDSSHGVRMAEAVSVGDPDPYWDYGMAVADLCTRLKHIEESEADE